MDEFLVSVIIPAYNARQTIDKCIGSVVEQSFCNIEVLIVDDGSSDGTTDIIETLIAGDERIRLIRCSHNGVVAARRTGIRAAKGDYITFVDSDDWLDEKSLECLAQYAKESKADITVGCARTVMGDGRVRGGVRRTLPSGVYKGEKLKNLYKKMMYDEESGGEGVVGSVWASLFRKEILERSALNIPDEVTYGEDAAMMYLSLLNADSVFLGDDYVYNYYRHSESASTGMRTTAFYEINLFYNYMKEEIGTYDSEWGLLRQLKLYMCALLRMALSANFPLRILPEYVLKESILEMLEGKNVLIYGAGAVGESFFLQLKRSELCSEVIICDKKLIKKRIDDTEVLSIKDAIRCKPDYILIANNDMEVINKIYKELLSEGFEREKLIKPIPPKNELLWRIVLE